MGILTFLDWSLLGTFSGAVGLTVIIVQLLKLPIDKVWKIPTRFLVYLVCLTIMLLAQFFIGGGLTLQAIAITALNAVLGTLTAMALYEQVIALPEKKKLIGIYEYMTTGVSPDTITDTTEGKATDREGESGPPPDDDTEDGNGET